MEQLRPILLLFVVSIYGISLTILLDALFERRLRKIFHHGWVLTAVVLLYVGLLLIPSGTSFLRAGAYLCVLFAVLCLYRGKLQLRLCIALLHYITAAAMETVLLSIIVTIEKMPLSGLGQSPVLAVMGYLLPGTFLFTGSLLLARLFHRWKNQIELSRFIWLAIFLFAAFTLFAVYFTASFITTGSSLLSLLPVLCVIPLFMSIGLLLLLNKLTTHYRMNQENLALQEQMHYNRLSLQVATESYEAQRSLTHDFDNHLLTIVQLLQAGQGEEALTYAKTVTNSVTVSGVVVSTNHPVADAVLNQKYRTAQELGIQMQFLVSDLSDFPLSTDEMVTVLANLLDNALEACATAETAQKKSIRVKLLMEPALATLSVQNTSQPVMVSQEGEISTTKQKRSEHGFELKNCKKILRRSGFDFALQYKDGWFQFTAIKAL